VNEDERRMKKCVEESGRGVCGGELYVVPTEQRVRRRWVLLKRSGWC